MYNFNTTITNEGAALLARIIANQENAAFKEARLSETNYVGQEVTLTAGTFGGVKYTDPTIAASVIDSTTIKVAFDCRGSSLIGAYNLYSIGIIIDDNGTDALVAVCASSDPLPIGEEFNDRYAFNVNLAVSSTSNITVSGTSAAVLYDTDVVDNLTSTATNKPLSANQGRLIADNLAANENVYGAKNRNVYPYKDTTKTENGMTFTDNGDGTITVSAASYPYTVSSDTTFYCSNFLDNEFKAGTWTLNGSPVVSDDVFVGYVVHYGGEYLSYLDKGQEVTFTQAVDTDDVAIVITLKSGYVLAGALLFKPMLRGARILDPTFAPYAKTNKQLTDDKAERNDISTIHATGSTNTTGALIGAGTFYYLNGQFCKALQNIGIGAPFTENTNYKKDNVGEELAQKVRRKLYVVTPGNSLTLTSELPPMYLIATSGSIGAALSMQTGVGYGATTARHASTPLITAVDSGVIYTVNASEYGLTVANNTAVNITVSVVDLAN